MKKKNKPFNAVYKYINTPDAEERIFRAMSILLPEEDIFYPSLVKIKDNDLQ